MSEKKLEVYLNVGANPPVVVDRDASGYKKSKIEWVRGDGEDFDFSGLAFWSDGALSNPQVQSHKIKADNDHAKTGAHEYVLSVTKDGATYSSTELNVPPTGDKPVIRN